MKPVADPVGVMEIAERLGVSRQLVAQWHKRGRLPPPAVELGMGPLWSWPDVEQWARETHRL